MAGSDPTLVLLGSENMGLDLAGRAYFDHVGF